MNVLYVQLESFTTIRIPNEIEKIKLQMCIIYLLAQAVYRDSGIWPFMIPVATAEGVYKFVKKGKSRNEELVRLFKFMMKGIEASHWSAEMQNIY